MKELVPVERRHLAKLGHGMKAVVQIGHAGLTPEVVDSTVKAVKARELIKVKANPNFDDDIKMTARQLAERSHSQLVQVVGKTFLLYCPLDKDSKIAFPPDVAAKARRKRRDMKAEG